LADNSRNETAKNYLKFYARQYPKIQSTGPLEIVDEAASNMVRTIEHYRIDEFWVRSEDGQRHKARLDALTLDSELTKPEVKLRSTPLSALHPHNRSLRMEVHLPESWAIEGETNTLTSAAGRLTARRSYRDRVLTLDYHYESLTNLIPVERVPEHLRALDRMEEELQYALTWGNAAETASSNSPNWPILTLAGMYSVLCLAGAVVTYRWRGGNALPLQPPPLPEGVITSLDSPKGLGGWLILVGIGVVIGPFYVLAGLKEDASVYSLEQWQALTVPSGVSYHPGWAPALILTLLGNLTLVAYGLLLTALFFEKRRTFPRLFIIFLLFRAAVVLGSGLIQLIPNAESGSQDLHSEITRTVVACGIWIPYMRMSRRVRATFVN